MYLCSSAINSPATPNIFHMTHMQGIVSILRSDNATATPLRRTLSADMSSKKWLADNGLPLIKKIPSSEQIAIDSSSSSDSDEEECEAVGKGDQNPTRVDIWTAIMSQKKQDDSGKLPPPYVHPLVKKSASSLSEKSLKVCTESLGSETGSDVLLSSPPASDDRQEDKEEHKMVKLPCFTAKKAPQARSLPPPLPSLAAARTDGPSLHMHSRRVDGRLVVEAVAVQQQKYFEAQRHDGRFLLTLINDPKQQQPSDQHVEDETETDKEKDMGILKERPLNSTTTVINVYKSTVAIKRIFERDNEKPASWSRKLAEVVEEEEAAVTQCATPARSRGTGLPPLPPVPASSTVNPYQYFWRAKPTVASVINTQHRPPTKSKDVVLLRGNKADCILPSLKGCKEPRRSLLMWEPFCIATS